MLLPSFHMNLHRIEFTNAYVSFAPWNIYYYVNMYMYAYGVSLDYLRTNEGTLVRMYLRTKVQYLRRYEALRNVRRCEPSFVRRYLRR